MPAMVTFFISYPSLLLIIFIYSKDKTVNYLLGIVILLSIVSFGILYIFQVIYFIHLFPTFVTTLLTIILIRLTPFKMNELVKISAFIFLFILISINTQFFTIFNPQYSVEEKINDVLYLKKDDVVKLHGEPLSFPDLYNSKDFISFGVNEGVGAFWTYPKFQTVDIKTLLENSEVIYTRLNNSSNHIQVNYSENNKFYTLNIQISKNKKILSSLTIKDRLPHGRKIDYKVIQQKKVSLDSFNHRLEYLLRHNIWNYFLYLFDDEKEINSVVTKFLEKSISLHTESQDWSKKITNIDGLISYTSELENCSSLDKDDYKDYPFNVWKEKNDDSNIINKGRINIVDINGTFFTTYIYSSDIPKWSRHDFSFSNNDYLYLFRNFQTAFEDKKIRLFQLNKTGKVIKYIHVKLPKDKFIDGREWHPISHVMVDDNGKIVFRVYTIYQKQYLHLPHHERPVTKDQCKYDLLEIEIP
jgi:hypothetical protein